MSLRDKLKKFEKNNKPQKPKNRNKGYKNEDAFTNKIINNKQGSYLKSINKYNLEYEHGLYQINKLFQKLDVNTISTIANIKVENIIDNIKNNVLFIDTETTGLMGGTGTVAFLIGAGYFSEDNFVIEQYIMRDYDEEPPMLYDIKKLMEDYSIIVSFNGKSFDLPLIKTRFILNRFERFNFDLHLDLLHSARRIWSFLDSCSLNSLENNILNFKRVGDIPGHLIPGIYFDFLEKKDLELLSPVLEHNIYDILSLVTLFTHLKEVHLDNVDNLTPHELFHLGRIKEKDKDYKNCINYLKQSIENSNESTIRYRALKKLSWQYKRVDQYEKAVEIWQEMIEKEKLGIFPYVEMAKYLEHKKKDYDKALRYTNESILLLKEKRLIMSNYDKKLTKLEYRKERLKRKIAKN